VFVPQRRPAAALKCLQPEQTCSAYARQARGRYMNTLTSTVRGRALGVAAAIACLIGSPLPAEEAAAQPEPASKQQNIRVGTGLTVGAGAGGPVGAIFGAAAGAWLGDRYHKQSVTSTTLATDLDKSETERTRLTSNVSELNGSLTRSREHGERLDKVVARTDQ